MGKKRILIIDDEKDFCSIVKMNLENTGDFELSVATNGKKGLELAKKLKPDLILLDIHMPGMDGFEVLEKLKKNLDTIEIPVVILSALKDEETKLKAAGLYDDLYITKPIDAINLKAKILEVLERRNIKKVDFS
ncbi:MAG: response regulator [Candidatus Omnitrophica bacterium]|nr:response regulator [Candidatus Omnitrophota bacterium]